MPPLAAQADFNGCGCLILGPIAIIGMLAKATLNAQHMNLDRVHLIRCMTSTILT